MEFERDLSWREQKARDDAVLLAQVNIVRRGGTLPNYPVWPFDAQIFDGTAVFHGYARVKP